MASSTGVPSNPNSHNVASILGKLQDPDADIRYMTLNDLNKMMEIGSPTFLSHDYNTCAKTVDGLLHTLGDSRGDVQNMAIQALGSFTKKAPAEILCPTIEKVSMIKTENTVDATVAALAVREIVVNLGHPLPGVARTQRVLDSYAAVSRALIPRLVGKIVVPLNNQKSLPSPPRGMLEEDLETGNDSNSLDLLAEVARTFGPMLQEAELKALETMTMQVLESEKCGTVMKKKAVGALSAMAPYFTDALLAHHVSYTIEQLRQPHVTPQARKLYLTDYGTLARSIPQKFGPYLKTLGPFVVSPLSQEELEQQREQEAEADGERDVAMEEVREASLIAIESFLEACAADMKAYVKEVLESSTRFLKYEPNVADDDEDEDMEEEQEEDDEFEAEEDFEEETGFEDEDDVSWKVRRCSAKVLHALIKTLDPNDPAVYGQIAPALIARFKEREESVRNEVITTLAFMIVKSGSSIMRKDLGSALEHTLPPSRKRRRGFSDATSSDLPSLSTSNGYASPSTPPPADNATQGLAKINPEVVKASAKLLKTSTVSTKQVVISLLKDMVTAQHGGLSQQADQVIDPVIETMNTAVTGVAGNALRVEALTLLRAIAETHSGKVIQPHLAKIVPVLVKAAKDRLAKVSGEAFGTIDAFAKALTPPRSAASKGQNGEHLKKLLDVSTERTTAKETDTEVRQKAVQALGLLVARTAGSSDLLSQGDRFSAQQLILERSKNELTRLACVRAFEIIGTLATNKDDYAPDFVRSAALELGAQLQKSSRVLRGASLTALRVLAVKEPSRLSMDDKTTSALVEALIPLLRTDDLHMMGPALIVLAAFAQDKAALVTTQPMIDGICSIITSSLSNAALDPLITCVGAIGQAGAGQGLMKALLNVGVQGDTDVTGQVIGTLLVKGGSGVGVKLDDFVKELQTQSDESKKCLALSVLGETALRMGESCPLQSDSFTSYFADDSDKVKLAAAVALGRAGAGNVKAYLPKIMDALNQGRQYLLLHSVKELLQHSDAEHEVKPYAQTLWQNIINTGQAEDNKVVSAECVGRLAIIDPASYLPQLQTFLQNPNATIRGMVIAALRYVFSETNETYDDHLRNSIIQMLATMLADSDLDNQRLSLSAFNSALHNKPNLVIPHLPELLPYAIQASIPRPELIREVQMGPFKHKVDDGLEMRKSAYETMYALLESPASRSKIDMASFYDRITAGISDEHEIKILCCLVLGKLFQIAPHESIHRGDSLAQQFRVVLAFKPKENAVKQELEKLAEQQKAVVKVAVAYTKAFVGEETRGWRDFIEWVRKDFTQLVKASEDELKSGITV
ncbi:TIP120-domain-containing protein [Hortaea werneckii]|uniref:TATA-binding protein interacting (TIP20) domain-containing protein n=2 Tax=Hortaea werneckii TaxID=91943 RepID=A0A3M7J9D8_HORWE|nr:TIP120-domain-containing protein [Hortaea werneckii]OTA24587.1 hypothetical protein BTJ68_12685 [Hortaea werneckii EXF-2000]KAI6838414.1 TIP120-domain-containing protein [Hortaea werneckii]KAI6934142.1 TIP120-domain-containing protein [Hortaea werneckii]KAI6938471.1 TIP120-domain-containing protein [Hortaea werneckii]